MNPELNTLGAIIALVATALLIALVVLLIRGRKKSRLEELVADYRRRTGLPARQAADSLDAQVDRLRKKNPGQTLEWYVERVLKDLDRDR